MSIDKIVNYLFSIDNPIYYALVFTLLVIGLVQLFYKYIYIPNKQRLTLKLKESELKNIKLLALFSELDPDPVIRINNRGYIIEANATAKEIFNDRSLYNLPLRVILPDIEFNIKEVIKKDKSYTFYNYVRGRYYLIVFKGISYLNIGQLYFNDLTERKLFEDELELSRQRLKKLMLTQQDKIEEEKNKIARDLHDSIGQSLLLLKLNIQKSRKNNGSSIAPDNYSENIDLIDRTIRDLKIILYELKPKILEELGLKAGILSLSQRVSADSGIKGDTVIVGLDNPLDPKLEVAIYRIIQEAINNIVKHSRATSYSIILKEETEKIKILISDDGVGFNTNDTINDISEKGFGLNGIRERVDSFWGTFKIETAPGEGTLLSLEFSKNQEAQ